MKSKTTLFVLASLLGAASLATAEDAPKRPVRPLPPEILKQFDKDGDGKLSEDERAAMRTAGEARKAEFEKKMLEKFDTDKDGKLSDEEKKAAREAGGFGPGPGGPGGPGGKRPGGPGGKGGEGAPPAGN
ncbi:MAG: hypothetical protein CFE26_14980 [Verrucomicrobiales bacterium VVV1]|nr:MAG: hypothetical protein CFE26_14980 [Verrucomicrobiales bacterium VVV1]